MKILVVSLCLLLLFAIAIAASIPREPARTMTQAPVQQAGEPDKESAIRNTLASLLADSGVHVGDALPKAAGPTYKALHVRWESPSAANPDNLHRELQQGLFALLSANQRSGALPRDRSLEFSTNQILIIGLDGKENLRSWRLILDPRLVRGESPKANGELSGQEFYLANVEFWLEIPDDPSLKQVRLYQPRWTGKNFQLELVSAFAVE